MELPTGRETSVECALETCFVAGRFCHLFGRLRLKVSDEFIAGGLHKEHSTFLGNCFLSRRPLATSIVPKFYLSFWTTCPYKERFRHCFVTERKCQWEVREALKAINHRTPRRNIKIWAKADTGREKQLC